EEGAKQLVSHFFSGLPRACAGGGGRRRGSRLSIISSGSKREFDRTGSRHYSPPFHRLSIIRAIGRGGAGTMKTYLYLFTMFLGILLTVHLAMNGKVGAVLNNPRVGNALFWCIGAAMALAPVLWGGQAGAT